MNLAGALFGFLFACMCASTQPSPARSKQARAEFQRATPCPVTSKARGPCPGYVVDHIVPLCRGGPDTAANMQWQTVAEGRAKDKMECKR